MHSTQLIYIVDPMCSWCWGFNPVMQQLHQQAQMAGVNVTLRVGGLRTGEQAVLDEQKRTYILQHWRAVAQATGQPFNFTEALPSGFLYDTEPACRALMVARELDETRLFKFLDSMQRAFYQDAQDITQAHILRDLAVQAGYASEAFCQAFDAPQSYAATQAEFAWVKNLAVSGFPTVLAQHQQQYALLTNGYQPYAALEPLLSRWISTNAST
ncbi:MAG TPA: DsbA family protein [Gammaproteobacteria bacterium]|nr:DsbA family protein [Gammaproteobacteria bacterium]